MSSNATPTLNLDDVGKPKLKVPEGTYEAMVSSAKSEKTKNNLPALVIEFALTDAGLFTGEKYVRWCTLAGPGAGYAREVLLAFHDEAELVTGFKVVPKFYFGKPAIISLVEEWYDHPVHTNTSEYEDAHENGDLSSTKFRRLAVKDVFAAADEKAQSAAKITQNSLPAGGADEETPF